MNSYCIHTHLLHTQFIYDGLIYSILAENTSATDIKVQRLSYFGLVPMWCKSVTLSSISSSPRCKLSFPMIHRYTTKTITNQY